MYYFMMKHIHTHAFLILLSFPLLNWEIVGSALSMNTKKRPSQITNTWNSFSLGSDQIGISTPNSEIDQTSPA